MKIHIRKIVSKTALVALAALVVLGVAGAGAMGANAADGTPASLVVVYYASPDNTHFMRSDTPMNLAAGSGSVSQTVNLDGSIVTSLTNVSGYADSGFGVNAGTLEDLNGILIQGSGDAFAMNLYFDKSGDGEYFAWTNDTLDGLGGDAYSLGPESSDGVIEVTDATLFYLIGPGVNYSLAQLKAGEVDGIDGTTLLRIWIGDCCLDTKSSTISYINISSGPITDFYVDDDYSAGNAGTHIFGVDEFDTIQDAVDAADDAATIHIAAGTYLEEVTVDKPLTLLGPNGEINPNTGTRSAEAVVQPVHIGTDPNNASTCTGIITVGADNVTIQGLTVDGNNPALTSGVLVNGVDVDACIGIDGSADRQNITIENNIVENIIYAGVNFEVSSDPAAASNNYIRYNRLFNIGNNAIGWGIGVVLYNNFYADVSYNVLDDVRVGIQTGNFEQANPGTTASISHNQISTWRRGIFHNLHYGSASPFTIDSNTLDVIDSAGTDRWDAIMLSSIQTTADAIVTNNVITAADVHQPTVGFQVWNTPTTAALTISGGSVTGADYGVWVNNYEGYKSNAASTSVTVDGVTISDASLAGVFVQDDPKNTIAATVHASILNSPISTSSTAVKIVGSDASAEGSCNQISGNTAGVNNTTATILDFEKNWWGSLTGPSGVGAGKGDTVSANVDYIPWNSDTTCTKFISQFYSLYIPIIHR